MSMNTYTTYISMHLLSSLNRIILPDRESNIFCRQSLDDTAFRRRSTVKESVSKIMIGQVVVLAKKSSPSLFFPPLEGLGVI